MMSFAPPRLHISGGGGEAADGALGGGVLTSPALHASGRFSTTPSAATTAGGRFAALLKHSNSNLRAAAAGGFDAIGDPLEAAVAIPPRSTWPSDSGGVTASRADAGLIDAAAAPRTYASSVADAVKEARMFLALPRFAVSAPAAVNASSVGSNRAPGTLPPPPMLSEWSLVEDRLLLTLDDRGGDIITGYSQAHERLPLLYPKPVRAVVPGDEGNPGVAAWVDAVRARLQALQTPALRTRARLLRGLSDEEVDGLISVFRTTLAGNKGAQPPSSTPPAAAGGFGTPFFAAGASLGRSDAFSPLLSGDTSADFARSALTAAPTATYASPTAATGNGPRVILRGITRLQARKAREAQEDVDRIIAGVSQARPGPPHGTGDGNSDDRSSKSTVFNRVAADAGDTITCPAHHVCSRSKFIKVLYDEQLESITNSQHHHGDSRVGASGRAVPAAAAKPPAIPTVTVTLDESDSMYQRFQSLEDVFAIDNLRRFAMFSETPDILYQQEAKAAQCEKTQKELAAARDEVTSQCRSHRTSKCDVIRMAEEEALVAASRQIDEWFQADVATLKAMYDAHRHVELGKLKKNFDRAREEMSVFFDAEEAALTALVNAGGAGTGSNGSHTALAELAELNRRASEVLPRYGLSRLLLLSELLVASELKEACITLIAKDVGFFMADRALASPVLSVTTVQELCAQIPLPDLIAACQKVNIDTTPSTAVDADGNARIPFVAAAPLKQINAGIAPEFLWHEFRRRARDALAVYKRLSFSELRQLRAALQSGLAQSAGTPQLNSSDRLSASFRAPRSPDNGAAALHARPYCDVATVCALKELLLRAYTEAERSNTGGIGGAAASLRKAASLMATFGGATKAVEADAPQLQPQLSTYDHESLGAAWATSLGITAYAAGPLPKTARGAAEPVAIATGVSVSSHNDRWLLASRVVKIRRARTLFRVVPTISYAQHAAAASRRCGESSLKHYFEAKIINIAPKCGLAVTVAIGFEALGTSGTSSRAPHGLGKNALGTAWARATDGAKAAPGAASVAVMWSSDGVLTHDGRSVMFPVTESGATFVSGDIVGIGVDERTGSLCFSKNGRLLAAPEPAAFAPIAAPAATAEDRDAVAAPPTPQTQSTTTSPSKDQAQRRAPPLVSEAAAAAAEPSTWLHGLLLGQGPLVPVLTIYSAASTYTGADIAAVGVNFSGPWLSATHSAEFASAAEGSLMGTASERRSAQSPELASQSPLVFDAFVEAIGRL